MAKISAVIITYNEEKNIERCLASLHTVCDEIIVLDSFSNDKTVEICKIAGIMLYQHKWLGYAGAKNLANEKATHDWILSIAADAALSPGLADSILKIKNNLSHKFYSFNRLTNYCGTWIKNSGWYPDTKIRLFDRQKAHWEGLIHEKLIYDMKIPIVNLKGDLYHYSYYTYEDHERQIKKYSTLAAEELKLKGKKSNIIKELFFTASKFLETYIFKKAFLDGAAGFKISVMTAKATRLKYQKLRKL
ncbi:MAG: glycosyltransferase family 2 protein [Bacteroidia bacterium]